MNKLESFLLLIGVYSLIIVAGGIVYNLFTGELDDE
jgi:hypothetical protein